MPSLEPDRASLGLDPQGDDMRDVLFVRIDGLFAVAHIDSAGELVETQVGDDATIDWTHIVAVG